MAAESVEVRARYVSHALVHRLEQQLCRIHAGIQLGENEQPAFRPRVMRHAGAFRQTAQHPIQLLLVALTNLRHMRRQQAAAKVRIHNGLIQQRRVHIAGLLPDHALAQQRLVGRQIPNPQSRRDHLGKAAHERHPAFLIEGLDGRQRLSAVTQIPIRIILRHHHAILRRQLRNLPAPGQRQRPPGGVLEGGNHVKQLGMLGAEYFLQQIHPHARFIAGHGQKLRLIELDALHVSQERGILHHHLVPRIDQRLAKQIHGLGGTGDGQNLVRRTGEGKPLLQIGSQAFLQRRIALRGAVLQKHLSLFQQKLPGQLRRLLIRQGRGSRITPGKGNHPRHGQQLENFANGAAGNAVKAAGKGQLIDMHQASPFLNEMKNRLP